MKTLQILGVSLLAASMGFVATAPVYAGSTAASLSAVFIAAGSDTVSTIGGDVASASSDILSLSVSAAAGANSATAGGYANASEAVSIGGAVEDSSNSALAIDPAAPLSFTSTIPPL